MAMATLPGPSCARTRAPSINTPIRIYRSGDNGKPCTVRPTRQWVDGHADGAYAALFFDIVCAGAPKRITLDYRLFFALDPSHRGILVLRSGERTATSLLSPQNARIELGL